MLRGVVEGSCLLPQAPLREGLVKRREELSERLGHALQIKGASVAVADEGACRVVLGNEDKAPASTYLIDIVGGALGELEMLQTSC